MKPVELKARADAALEQASYDPRKLFFLYGAVSLGLGLLIALLDMVLAESIADTVGLAGMQTRAVLATAQSGLQIISAVILPFLQFGLVYGCLRLIRTERAEPGVLTEGFRRLGPVLRLLLMKGLVLFGALTVCSYAASLIFMITPLSQGLVEQLTPILESGDMAAVEAVLYDETSLQQMLPHMTGFFVIFLVLVCGVGIPLAYRMSMTDFVVMDEGKRGGFGAIRESFRITKGHCMQLFRLDLSFWWFYALNGLAGVLMNLDSLLTLAGITLPVSAKTAYLISYGLYTAAHLVLLTLAAPKVRTTYAAAYETMKQS